ncbi:trypsin-like serine protease [Micromonospora sp. SH-82]|uniref:trypsin-like serine protease n=1 Tax=Micromonospora sp. SH-82 TaxID=3132938 RepID=UPI003EC03F95
MTVTGWGTKKAGGPQERFLDKVELPFLPDEQCFDDPWWDEHPEYPRSTICAKSVDQKSHGPGDSGGAALRRLPRDGWEQVGIVTGPLPRPSRSSGVTVRGCRPPRVEGPSAERVLSPAFRS